MSTGILPAAQSSPRPRSFLMGHFSCISCLLRERLLARALGDFTWRRIRAF